MKKVCFLVDSIFTIGGVQRVTAVIAKELSKTCDVTIVTFDEPAPHPNGDEPHLHYRFFRYPTVGTFKNLCCKAYSACYRKLQPQGRWTSNLYAHSSFPSELRLALADELRQGHYDTIIGVHAPLAVRLATLKPLLPGVRCIGWIHNSFEALFSPASPYIGPELLRHYVWQFRQLDATVVLCQHDADSYRHYDAQLQTTVIYNPLTLQPGAPSKGNSKRFLAVGRFSHQHKGFDLLIEAFRLFACHDSEWTLDIVGQGQEENAYRKLISKYRLEDRIVIHPFTNDIQSYYSQAQVYVLSSRWEGMPLVLVEAMSHGLPVVTSDLPVCKEIMGDFGIYFANGDVNGMAQALLTATRINWSAKSRQAVETARRYNIDNIIPQWKALIG